MGRVDWLPAPPGVMVDPTLAGATHPNRAPFDRSLADPSDGRAWDRLRDDYRDQSSAWRVWTEQQSQYSEPVAVALKYLVGRGLSPGDRDVTVEVGAGTGEASRRLIGWPGVVLVSDVVHDMVKQIVQQADRLVLDVRHLPFRDSSVQMIVGLNAVPHLSEFSRALAPDGLLVWCSSFGPETPLYVTPERLCDELGREWVGVAGRVGAGDWCVLSRGV